MSQVVPFRGALLEVKRKNVAVYDLVCMCKSKELTETWEYEDATVVDCDNPTNTPVRRSVKKSSAWSVSLSGICDGVGYNTIRGDASLETASTYQFVKALPLAQGGGTYEGQVWFENISIGTNDNGVVTFKAQLRGEGPLTYTPAAA